MAFLTKPGALLISEGLAAENGLKLGDPIMLDAGGRQSTGFVAGLLHPSDALSRRALDGLILADLATAQEITGRIGRLDTIDLILPRGDLTGFANLSGPSAASRRPGRTRTPSFGRAGADDRSVPHESDRAQPAGAGRRHVSDLQQHDFLGGAAPAAFRHAALPGGDARRDRRPGVGRGGDGRRARFAARPCVGRDPGPGRGAGGDADHQRSVLRRDSARDRDPRRQPGQGCGGWGVRNGGRGRAAGLGGDDRLAAPGAHPVRPGGDGAAAGAVDGACGRYRDCSWRRAVGSPHPQLPSSGQAWRSALRASSP